jgi:hypothetical protein
MIENRVSMADEEGLWFGRRVQMYRGELRYFSPLLLSADIGGVILLVRKDSEGYHEPR